MLRTKTIVIAILLILLLSIAMLPAHAATFTVTDCTSSSGAAGRLAEQITAAAAGDTIDFSCGTATIPFTSAITITKNLTIDGGGTITFNGGGTTNFLIITGQTITVSGITFTNGNSDASGSDTAGAIFGDSAILTVTNCIFSNNQVTDNSPNRSASAIYLNNSPSLTISGSTFNNNTSNGSFGEATVQLRMFSNSPMTLSLSGSSFTGNNNPEGLATVLVAGGLSDTVTTMISNTSFSNNYSKGTGGVWVAMSNGNTTISGSTFSNNTFSPAFGGASGSFVKATLGGTFTVSGSTFVNSTCGTGYVDGGGNTSDLASTGCPNPTVVVVPVDPAPEVEVVVVKAPVLGCALDTTDGVEVAGAPDNTYCRVLMRNGGVVSYSGAIPADLIGLGVILAVDVYRLEGGATVNTFPAYSRVCLSGSGRLFYMDGRNAPRFSVELASESVDGLTCGWIPAPGTLILTN